MIVLISAVVILLVISLVYAFINSLELSFGLEINTLRTPFYKLGMSFQRYTLEDGTVEDELVIGLFFINIVVIAWKENEA